MARAHLNGQILKAEVKAYSVPTPGPESDGTLTWDKTTLVLVQIQAGNFTGVGYTYADTTTADLIHEMFIPRLVGQNPLDIPKIEKSMREVVRNLGRPGIAAMAISAVDTALWDLKGKLLGVSILDLLGAVRDEIPVYGSGGFTNFSDTELAEQLGGWQKLGISRFKIKIGRDQKRDFERIKIARELVGPFAELYVDANGAYSVKQALEMASRFREFDVKWFEEPVVMENVEGLKFIRERLSPEVELASGEYGYELGDFKSLLPSVDVLQADVTRCGGYSGFLRVSALARASSTPLSSHCAPTLHAPLGLAMGEIRHLEYFSDHTRIEEMFFDGIPVLKNGAVKIDRSRPGIGIDVKFDDLEKLAA